MCTTLFSRCFRGSNLHDDTFYDRVLQIHILHQQTIISDPSSVKTIKSIDIDSKDLASMSPFFQKMFTNGMKESNEKQVTMKIASYEQFPFEKLMQYIKHHTLPTDTVELLELLIIAEKFEVPSCIKLCIDSLCSKPIDCELALLFLSLPKSIYVNKSFQILLDCAKEFFGKKLLTLDVFPEEIGDVDQAVIETVLSPDDIWLGSEDVAYDFLMKWVLSHFADSEERCKFLFSHVRRLIRFPFLSPLKQDEFQLCPYADKDLSMEIRTDCLAYAKEIQLLKQGFGIALRSRHRRNLVCKRRIYMFHRVEVIKQETDETKCDVLFELEKEEFKNMERVGVVYSDTFTLKDRGFYLALECKSKAVDGKPSSLGLCLHMREVPILTVVGFDVAYAAKRTPDEFVRKELVPDNGLIVFNSRKSSAGFGNFLGTPWKKLEAEDSEFFVNGSMLLKATIRVLN